MKKVLAVSGGIDSMSMLDIFVKKFPKSDLVVATFNHGTRESSEDDIRFVSEICFALKISVYRGEVDLGNNVSEEKARTARYDFLRKVAAKERGEIYTAHHLDDLVETTAINFLRGTDFRGLACFSALGIRRPFLDGFLNPNDFGFRVFDKNAILAYAAKNSITFREDPTNETDNYLRNRVRKKTRSLPLAKKLAIYELWKNQRNLVREIDNLTDSAIPEDLKFVRADFMELDDKTALEILRSALLRAGISTTIPQRKDFLRAIRTYGSGKTFNLPKDRLVKINKNDFML